MAALFNHSPRPGPIVAFKTRPKVSTVAAFKMWRTTYTLGRVLNNQEARWQTDKIMISTNVQTNLNFVVARQSQVKSYNQSQK